MAAYSFQKDPWSGVTSRNGIPADELTSMLRGAIRRGEEKTALAAAYEMYLTSPQLLDRAWRSLLSASVEDVGFGAPEAPETVWALYGMRRSFDYTDGDQPIFLVYAVRCLCRSRKDRSSGESAYMLAKRFAAGYIPEVPDYAYDMHTVQGREQSGQERQERALPWWHGKCGSWRIPAQRPQGISAVWPRWSQRRWNIWRAAPRNW